MGRPVGELDDRLSRVEVSAIKIDGFDAATMGYTKAGEGYALVYSYWRCIQVLMEANGWDVGDTLDYFEYNVMGSIQSYDGMPAPIIVHDEQWL
jgi:hypothetical protein